MFYIYIGLTNECRLSLCYSNGKICCYSKINKEEFSKELSSLDSITLTSLLACALIKLFSNSVKTHQEEQDDLMEIEIVRELEEKNIIPFKKINSSVKIFDFNIAQDNIFDYLKCYYNQNKNEFYTTDSYDEIPEIRILQVENTNSFTYDNKIFIIDGYYINELFDNPDLNICSLGFDSKTDIIRFLELTMLE